MPSLSNRNILAAAALLAAPPGSARRSSATIPNRSLLASGDPGIEHIRAQARAVFYAALKADY